jgi:hypothetical protein
MGKEREASSIVNELEGLSQVRYVSPYLLAMLHAGLGDDERALQFLERAYHDRCVWMVFMNVEPEFERLRGDDRFIALSSTLNLSR